MNIYHWKVMIGGICGLFFRVVMHTIDLEIGNGNY
jgi:hypothetical protein